MSPFFSTRDVADLAARRRGASVACLRQHSARNQPLRRYQAVRESVPAIIDARAVDGFHNRPPTTRGGPMKEHNGVL
jgi:hypothetical protein